MKKKIKIVYYTRTMINDVSIFLTQQFQRKKCDAIFLKNSSMQRSRDRSFSQLLLQTIEMDEKIH
jgi:hypothetical protein